MDVVAESRAAYAYGRLVPFLGSGVSRKVCRTWTGMVEDLERLARVPAPGSSPASGDLALVNRAAQALDRRRLGLGIPIAESVRTALLENGPAPPPPSTAALAALHWPLVLTTNYDDLYVAAVHQRELRTRRATRDRTRELERRAAPVRVVGRSSIDCHRVLSALGAPAPPMLWALQGYLGGQATIDLPDETAPVLYDDWAVPHGATHLDRSGSGPGLADQIVVGHADYRRVALRSEGFRRTFAEVFRQRSLLFLGSGLADRYLFAQIIELYGPGMHPHYAIATKGTLDRRDRRFLQRNYGIWVHQIDSHDDLPDLVARLRGTVPSSRRYAYRTTSATLVVDTAPMPPVRDPSACVLLSGGRILGQPSLATWARRDLVAYGYSQRAPETGAELLRPDRGRRFIWRLRDPVEDGPLVLVARARLDPLSDHGRGVNPVSAATAELRTRPGQDDRGRLWRDVRVSAAALQEALAVARAEGRDRVISSMLAAGGLRTVPAPVTLLAMLDAWSTAPPGTRPSLTVHVVDDDVRIDLESRRIDPARLLSAAGDGGPRPIPFWLELATASGDDPERILVVDSRQRLVRDLLADYGVAGNRWSLTVEPEPCLGWAAWRLPEIDVWTGPGGAALSLARIGVLPGSTIRLQEDLTG